jgi:hypothetical protein
MEHSRNIVPIPPLNVRCITHQMDFHTGDNIGMFIDKLQDCFQIEEKIDSFSFNNDTGTLTIQTTLMG